MIAIAFAILDELVFHVGYKTSSVVHQWQWDRNNIVSVELLFKIPVAIIIPSDQSRRLKGGSTVADYDQDFLWYSCERVSSEK